MKARWVVALGLSVALVLAVVLLRRDDAPRVDVIDTGAAPSPIDDTVTVEQAAPVTAPAMLRTPGERAAARIDDAAVDECQPTVRDAAAFAEMELNAEFPLSEEDAEARYRVELEKLRLRLIGSSDPESILAAFALDRPEAGVRNDPSGQAALLELGLRAADSDSALLKWHALRVCVEAEDYCPFLHLEQSLLDGQQENAEAWALAATLKYRRGDLVGALAAMQRAARASTSTWYWTETIAGITRVFTEHTSLSHMDGAVSAIGFAATALPSVGDVQQMCRRESVTSRAWAEACLDFGQLREEHNETMVARGLAYSLQKQALAAIGDLQGAEEAAEAYALYRAEVNAIAASTSLFNTLFANSPDRFAAHLSAVREIGELEGIRRFVRREAPPLLERAGLLDRDGARECIAQLFEAPTPAPNTLRNYPIENYPLQVGDELLIHVASQPVSLRVGPEGTIALRRLPAIAAVGKTTGQIRGEITALSSNASNPTPEVVVILMAPRSPEQRRIEFDEALRDAKEEQTR